MSLGSNVVKENGAINEYPLNVIRTFNKVSNSECEISLELNLSENLFNQSTPIKLFAILLNNSQQTTFINEKSVISLHLFRNENNYYKFIHNQTTDSAD